jgi:hypothetical protein
MRCALERNFLRAARRVTEKSGEGYRRLVCQIDVYSIAVGAGSGNDEFDQRKKQSG